MKNYFIIALAAVAVLTTACNKQPSATFKSDKSSVEVGEKITFTNTSVDGKSYLWDFGDGSSTTEENPVYSYLTYDDDKLITEKTVTLTAYSKNEKKMSTTSAVIEIYHPTQLELTVNKFQGINTVPEANFQVVLYDNQAYYTDNDETHRVAVATTDDNGTVLFSGLEPKQYFFKGADGTLLKTMSLQTSATLTLHEKSSFSVLKL